MITELKLKLKYKSEERLSYQITSVMHGILMGHIDREYGNEMHQNGLKPFTQTICDIKEDTFTWKICTLTEEAKIQIIDKLIMVDEFYMKHRDLKLKVLERNYKELSYDTLLENYYFQAQNRNITIRFYSPTSFKSQGNYVFMPSVRLIFQSLIQKYDEFSCSTKVGSEETLEQIEKYVSIICYNLKSTKFSLEGIRVPAFIGMITFRVKGPQQLANLIKMLLIFGQYSSVGIKTALGMGQIKVEGE